MPKDHLNLAIALLAVCGIHAQLHAQAPATVAEQYLLSAANQERAARGLPPLHGDMQLALAASAHARQMADHAEISHQFAAEAALPERGADAGVPFSLISENVAQAPSVVQIHDMWMHSEHHRSNLLDPAIDSVGISVVERGGELYAVEDFARTVRAVSLADQEAAIASLVSRPGSVALTADPRDLAAARQTCAMESGFSGARRPWFIMRFSSASLDRLPEELNSRMASGKYHQAAVGACPAARNSAFTSYSFAVLLYP